MARAFALTRRNQNPFGASSHATIPSGRVPLPLNCHVLATQSGRKQKLIPSERLVNGTRPRASWYHDDLIPFSLPRYVWRIQASAGAGAFFM